ncbi:unnamed protein product [Sphagnum balticum]
MHFEAEQRGREAAGAGSACESEAAAIRGGESARVAGLGLERGVGGAKLLLEILLGPFRGGLEGNFHLPPSSNHPPPPPGNRGAVCTQGQKEAAGLQRVLPHRSPGQHLGVPFREDCGEELCAVVIRGGAVDARGSGRPQQVDGGEGFVRVVVG